MKKLAALILTISCLLGLYGCGQQKRLQQGNIKTQYFFTATVMETHADYLLLEVFDTGNSNLSEGAHIEVSTDVVSADGCPEFESGECARVLLARNPDKNASLRLEALTIYKTDETGLKIAD